MLHRALRSAPATLGVVGALALLVCSIPARALDVSAPLPGGATYDVSGDEVVPSLGVGIGAGEGGTLNVGAGTTLTNSTGGQPGANIGDQDTSVGTVNITGTGATLTDNGDDTYIGKAGAGAIHISSGGSLVTQNAYLGHTATGSGTVTVDGTGSIWTNTATLKIGELGSGDVTISNGGRLVTHVALLGSPGASKLTITGAGSSWFNDNGMSGSGELTVNDGASVTFTGTGIYLGAGGIISIDGTGTNFTIGDPLSNSWLTLMGGTTSVTNGATLYSSGGFVGSSGTSLADMTVTGAGSSWNTTVRIYVGGQTGGVGDGVGRLTVSDGATVSSATVGVGIDTSSDGTLIVTGSGSKVSALANPSIPALGNVYVGYAGNALAIVSDGALLRADNKVLIASELGSSGTLVIGAEEGSAAAAPGTISSPSVIFGDGTGSIVFNHTGADYEFSSPISGAGEIRNIAGNTYLSGANSGFAGNIYIGGGTLTGNSSLLNAAMNVDNGGTLAGNTTVGGTTVLSGGTISPGNSIGTININGDLVQNAGSNYDVELSSDGTSDLVAVTGQATLASTVNYAPTSTYSVGSSYTILTANNIVGNFANNSEVLSYFANAQLNYHTGGSGDSVTADIVKTKSFASAAVTPNQIAVAQALDSISSGGVLVAVSGLQNEAEARAAYNQLSGEFNATLDGQTITEAGVLNNLLLGYLRMMSGDVEGGGESAMPMGYAETVAVNDPIGTFPPAAKPSANLWMSPYGNWQRVGGDSNTATTTQRIGGFLAGVDMPVFDGAGRVGVFAGYGRGSLSTDGRASSADTDDYHLGVYGSHSEGRAHFRYGATLSLRDAAVERRVVLLGLTNNLNGRRRLVTEQLFGELGYGLNLSSVRVEPFVGLSYVHMDARSYNEQGGTAALNVADSSSDVGFSTLGLRAAKDVKVLEKKLTLQGTLGWRHALGDVSSSQTQSFSGSTAFSVTGAPIARNALITEMGVGFDVSDSTRMSVSYSGQFGDRSQDHTARIGLSVAF